MNKHFLLEAAAFGGMFVVAGADLRANQIQEPAGTLEAHPSSNTDFRPAFEWRLHLMLIPGKDGTAVSGASGMHGKIYVAQAHDWKTPGLAPTTPVEIQTGGNNIVVMVLDNGPIYSSTNSGMTWRVINTPGTYEFPLIIGPKGGFSAAATIYPSPANQTATNPPASNWYAVGSAPNGSKLVMTGDASQPAPALTIRHSGGGMIVSWPAEFTGYVLQENGDFSSTNWVDVTNAVNTVGGQNQVNIPSPGGNNFYRLRSQ